jgi:hypothetical protein
VFRLKAPDTRFSPCSLPEPFTSLWSPRNILRI